MAASCLHLPSKSHRGIAKNFAQVNSLQKIIAKTVIRIKKDFSKHCSYVYTNRAPRQNGYDHYRGTPAKSDCGRRGSGDGSCPVWDPKLVDKSRYTNGLQRRPGANYQWRTENERKRNPSQRDCDSNSGNRSTRSTQSKWNDRSYHTQTRYGQEYPTQGREINITQRERSRYNELMARIAQLPT